MKTIIMLAFASVNAWLSLRDQSEKPPFPTPPGTIEFIADAGSPQVFTFEDWSFKKVEYTEGKVEDIQVELAIRTSSLSTGWKELEKNVRKKKEYFFVKKFPEATVTINGAEPAGENQFKTQAVFTIKGISRPVELTFTLEGRHVKGSGSLNRRIFDFTDEGPKDEIPLTFEADLPE